MTQPLNGSSGANGYPGPRRAAAAAPAWSLVRPPSRLAARLFPDLTEPERLVCAAFPAGALVDLENCLERDVRAGVLAALLLGAGEVQPGQAPALRLRGARVTGQLDLTGVSVRCPVLLEGCQFHDAVRLTDARTAAIRITRSSLPAFEGARLRTAGTLDFTGCQVHGTLRLDQARVTGPVLLDQVTVGCGAGPAITAQSMRAGRLILRPAAPARGLVDLGEAELGVLEDDPSCWPSGLILAGLTYRVLSPRLPARDRLPWLDRDPGGHRPQPYEQLAAHYRSLGQPAQARAVRYAAQRRQRHHLPALPRCWGLVQDAVAGYGYRPWRLVAWLAVLLAAGSAVFTAVPPLPVTAGPIPAGAVAAGAAATGPAPHFHAFLYTLQLLLPVDGPGLRHAFEPAGATIWAAWSLMVAGWVLIAVAGAAVVRLNRR